MAGADPYGAGGGGRVIGCCLGGQDPTSSLLEDLQTSYRGGGRCILAITSYPDPFSPFPKSCIRPWYDL